MTASDPRVGEIQARLDAATPGPWRWDEKYGDVGDTGLALTNDAGAEIVGAYNTHCCSFRDDPTVEDNDAEFIAAAPADVAYLLAELRDRDEKLARASDVIGDLTDPDECHFDHHGGCQAHGYLSLDPSETCPQHDAKEWVRAAVAAANGGGE